ncbi:MAG: hypothetical protein H7240_09640 [Glaciimonas sp.]|nr:hypothetical protein [Glaciimonas sp.]
MKNGIWICRSCRITLIQLHYSFHQALTAAWYIEAGARSFLNETGMRPFIHHCDDGGVIMIGGVEQGTGYSHWVCTADHRDAANNMSVLSVRAL